MTSIKVLYVASILQETPILLPIPPVSGGAPCWNIYRLNEELASSKDIDIIVTILSACEEQQLTALQAYPQIGEYKWYVISEFDRAISQFIHRSEYAAALLKRLVGVPSWLAFRYLRYAKIMWQTNNYDLLILDDAPQNLGFLRRFIPREKLGFTFRGQIGGSRKLLPSCGFLISTNQNLIKYVNEVMPQSSNSHIPRIYVVPNSLGAEFNKPEGSVNNCDIKEYEYFTIVFSGRLVPGKGVVELLRAFEIVYRQFPFTRLHIVGAGGYNSSVTTDYERTLHRMAFAFPREVVQFFGYIPYTEIPQHYSQAQLAVFPSILVEGFGMVALEAMRCRLPVVVSDQPGFRSIVIDGHNGRIVKDPTDTQELASVIIELIQEPNKRCQLALNGYETSMQYSPANAAQSFINAITDYIHITHA